MAKEGITLVKEKEFDEFEKNDQVMYRYCNEEGDVHIDYSPNGSINSIAGI